MRYIYIFLLYTFSLILKKIPIKRVIKKKNIIKCKAADTHLAGSDKGRP